MVPIYQHCQRYIVTRLFRHSNDDYILYLQQQRTDDYKLPTAVLKLQSNRAHSLKRNIYISSLIHTFSSIVQIGDHNIIII